MTFIPILIDDCRSEDIHSRLPEIQYLNFFKEPTRTIQRLVEVLVDSGFGPHRIEEERAPRDQPQGLHGQYLLITLSLNLDGMVGFLWVIGDVAIGVFRGCD
jgi:hypothetical protein